MRRTKEPHASGALPMLPSSLGPPPSHLSQASSLPSSLGPPPAHLRATMGITALNVDNSTSSLTTVTHPLPTQRSRMLQTRPSTASASSSSSSRKSVDFAQQDKSILVSERSNYTEQIVDAAGSEERGGVRGEVEAREEMDVEKHINKMVVEMVAENIK